MSQRLAKMETRHCEAALNYDDGDEQQCRFHGSHKVEDWPTIKAAFAALTTSTSY